MSFNTVKKSFDRKQVLFADLLLDQNNVNTGFANDPQSFNTPKTTSSSSAFAINNPKKIYRISSGSLGRLVSEDCIPYFPIISDNGVSFSPPKVKPGEKIGSSASISIKCDDIITNDAWEMPGSSDPAFDYSVRRKVGSFWNKLLARNYVENRFIKLYRGYQDPSQPFDINNFEEELYVIKGIKRDKDGGATITAVDPIFLTQEIKAKAPVVSTGVLSSSINATQTTITISTNDPSEYNLRSGETPAVLIDDELFFYDFVTNNNNGTVTLDVDRGTKFPGTTTKTASHDAGARVQKCICFENVNVVDCLRHIIQGYTKITPQEIDHSKWEVEKNGALSTYNLTTVLLKPTAVSKLIDQLLVLSGATMFWDTVLQKLTLLGNSEFDTPQFTYEEGVHIKQGSLSVIFDDKDQITRQAINFAKANYKESDDLKNYSQSFIYIDGAAEDESRFDTVTEGKEINSNWLTDSVSDISVATAVASRNVLRRSNIPKTFKFTTDPAYVGYIDGGRIWIGSVIEIVSSRYVGPDNEPLPTLAQITTMKRRSDGFWDIEAVNFSGNVSNIDFTVSSDKTDYTLTNDFTPIAGRVNTVLIEAGVTIKSSSTSVPALKTGVWPDGLLLINRGAILGAGGKGGDAGTISSYNEPTVCDIAFDAENGYAGGVAILAQTDVDIDNGLGGVIFGGGGGGAAQVSYNGDGQQIYYGGGGSGGQGGVGGLGGEGVYQGSQKQGQDGADGSINGPGTVNADGGSWGEKGQDTLVYACGNPSSPVTRNGGAAGKAISTNGFNVNITSGYNSAQIKGPVS